MRQLSSSEQLQRLLSNPPIAWELQVSPQDWFAALTPAAIAGARCAQCSKPLRQVRGGGGAWRRRGWNALHGGGGGGPGGAEATGGEKGGGQLTPGTIPGGGGVWKIHQTA
jgi:hypothetical protein